MKVKELTVKAIHLGDLSLAIQQELNFVDITAEGGVPIEGECFLVHPPKTILELEAQPLWAEFCRQEDFKVSDVILVQVPINSKIKRRIKK